MVSYEVSPAGGAAASRPGALATGGLSPLVLVFLVSLIVPMYIYLGTARLSPYRIVLLLAVVPLMGMWLSGRAGRVRAPDILVILFVVWSIISLTVVHGLEHIQFGSIFAIETLGAYFLGRAMVRSPENLRSVLRIVFVIVLFLMPIAWQETSTGRPLLIELAQKFGPAVPEVNIGGRMGLWRAQGPFDHPILYGVFCASAMGMTFYGMSVRGPGRPMAVLALLLIPLAAFPSLSSGAYLAMFFQFFLIVYELTTRSVPRRWRLLSLAFAIVYVTVDALSNRTPIPVFIEHFTFCGECAYNRVLIWEYGTAEVWRHPLFGIGLNDWIRAPWMSTSMDNFWLLYAVRHGLPAFIFLAAGILGAMWTIGGLKLADPSIRALRTGWLISIGGMCLALCTVHLWNAPYSYFLFLVGSGMWLLDAPDGAGAAPPPDSRARPGRPRPAIGAVADASRAAPAF